MNLRLEYSSIVTQALKFLLCLNGGVTRAKYLEGLNAENDIMLQVTSVK